MVSKTTGWGFDSLLACQDLSFKAFFEWEMITKKESMQNYIRWFLGLLFTAIAIYGNSYFALEPLLYRVLGVVFLIFLSLGVLITTNEGKEALKIILDSRREIKRVVWPTRIETTQTTIIVLIALTVTGLLLWGMDSFFGWVTANVLG